MPDSTIFKRRKIGSRACDACKIRKIRCSEIPPCDRCATAGIACTFNTAQATRGPRSLRPKTIREIQGVQREVPGRDDLAGSSSGRRNSAPVQKTGPPGDYRRASAAQTQIPTHTQAHSTPWPRLDEEVPVPSQPERIPVAALVLRLCIYRLRLFPVWPIVAVEEVIAALQRDAHDLGIYALANAVGAATMAQLKLDRARDPEINDSITASMMEAECRRALLTLHDASDEDATADPTLNTLRTSFLLHIYHENQRPGGPKSLLYLREAITLAQIMGLHKAVRYSEFPPGEQQMRRRIYALLFVTERGVAMLHDLPVVLKTGTHFPSFDDDDADNDQEALVLPAFRKLVKLFWVFDQSGAFNLIHGMGSGEDERRVNGLPSWKGLENLQHKLQESVPEPEHAINDVQKADICATQHWMRVLLWRARLQYTQSHAAAQPDDIDIGASPPILIARQFLEIISRLPHAALEAHGPTIEFKIFEIASAVTDAIAHHLSRPAQAQAVMDLRPNDILVQLQKMLAMCRGGNKSLLASLCSRIAQIEDQPVARALMSPERLPRGYDAGYGGMGLERRSSWATMADRGLGGVQGFTEREWPVQRSPTFPSWFSLVAAAERQGAAMQEGEGDNDEKNGVALRQQHAGFHGQPAYGGMETDLAWQPLNFLGDYGQPEDGAHHVHANSASGLDMLANITDHWFPAIISTSPRTK